jgi:hypothetical protein
MRRKGSEHMETTPTIEISSPIDFSSIGLYVLALQLTGVALLLTTITVSLPYIVPRAAASSVRTVACLCIVGIMCLRYPLRVGRTRGLVLVFHALRPGAAIYIVALVMEHLAYSDSENNFMGGMRSLGYHALILVLIACGLVRAVTTSPNRDAPFAIAILAATTMAFLPPESTSETSPLVGRPSGIGIADRYLRAVTFVLLYSSHAYSLAPTTHLSEEIGLTVARSVAASAWTLGCHAALLPIAIIQFGLVLANRLNVRHVEPVELYDKVETRSNASVLSEADTGVAAETARFLASLPGSTTDGVGGIGLGGGGGAVGDDPTDIELAALEVARDHTEGVPLDAKTLALVSRQAQNKKRGLGGTGGLLPR